MKLSRDIFEQLLSAFKRAWLDSASPSPDSAFRKSVLREVDSVEQSGVAGLSLLEQKFRASLLLGPEPEASAEFRRQIADRIRKEPAYEAEPSVVDIMLTLAEQYGVRLCSASVLFAVVTISRIGLVPKLPLDVTMFIG
ncbi:MAG: hypothetical protein U0136_08945 [Bdellovibrionota bacterium]